MLRRILVVVGVVAGGLILLLAAAVAVLAVRLREARDAKLAEIDGFYNPPRPLPAGDPGAVIRSEPVTAPQGVKAWRVLYRSTTYEDTPIAVSALVAVPDRAPPPGGFPLVAVAHGTIGMARICAPSLAPFDARIDQPSFYELMVQPFTDAGYAVSATDYRGLGTPGVNPYLVGEDAARNVLDAARMARRLNVAPLSDLTFIWGHSQGGQASAFAGQIAPRYAPELRVPGVVVSAPAAELALLAKELAGISGRSPITGIAVMIVRAWSAAYPDAKPSSALTSRGVEHMEVVDDQCIGGVLARFLLRPAPDYVNAAALARPPWEALIATNTPGSVATGAPMLVVQGGADPLIKPQFTEVYVGRLCALGERVRFNLYPGKGHNGVIEPSMPDTLAWMADRLAGRAPPSSC